MSATVSAHPPESTLTAFVLGQLDVATAKSVRAHLDTCEACRAVVEQSPHRATPSRQPAVTRGDVPAPVPPIDADELPPALRNHARYRVLRQLGRGGMGIVYQAEHTVMERLVALKVVSRHLLDSPEAVERFGREVRAAARLDHPNIVRAYDAEQADDLQLLVMEYVEGKSLTDVLDRKGPLPISHACQYVRQAALGLQHAHEKGMVHRDLKPANLMLTPKGVVKILDFGLAKLNSERKRGSDLTRKDMAMGTPEYMAPEQALDTKSADIRADIYALGCTLYCLLAGRPPFRSADGNDLQVIMAHIDQDPPPVTQFRPEVPSDLAALLARMLAKAPDQRPQTPKQVADALAAIGKSAPEKSARYSLAPAVPAPAARRLELTSSPATPFAKLTRADAEAHELQNERPRWLIPIVAVAGALLVGAVVIGLVFSLGSKRRAETRDVALNNKSTTEKVAPEPHPAPAPKPVETPPEPPPTQTEPATTPPTPVSPPPVMDGYRPLFNGRDLAGWSVVGDGEAFTISPTEPALIAQSALPISRLQTNQDYADFHLRLEYRVAKRGGLSGLDFRMPADSLAERPAPAIVIRDAPMTRRMGTGSVIIGPRTAFTSKADDEYQKPFGEWNQLVLDAVGPRVRVTLNGTIVSDVNLAGSYQNKDAAPEIRRPFGRIALRADKAEVWYRNIQIKELPTKPAPPGPDEPNSPSPTPPTTTPAPSSAERIQAAIAQLRNIERDLQGLDFTGQTLETQTRKTLKQGAIMDVRGAMKAIDDGKRGKDVQGHLDRAREKIQRLETMINPPKTASAKGKTASQKRKETVGHVETLLDEIVKNLIEANVLDARP